MPVKDFLSNFRYDPETFKPDEFIAAIAREYDTDESVWNAKVESTAKGAEKITAENSELKNQLWNYYIKSGAPITPANASGGQVPPAVEEDPNEYKPKGLLNAAFGSTDKE